MHLKILSVSSRSSDTRRHLPGNSDRWMSVVTAGKRNFSLSGTGREEGEYGEGGVSGEEGELSGEEFAVSGEEFGVSGEEFAVSGEDGISVHTIEEELQSDHPPVISRNNYD